MFSTQNIWGATAPMEREETPTYEVSYLSSHLMQCMGAQKRERVHWVAFDLILNAVTFSVLWMVLI